MEECDDQAKEAAIHDFNRRTEEREQKRGHTKRAPTKYDTRMRVGMLGCVEFGQTEN